MKSLNILFVAFALISASTAQAWTYTCNSQSISGKTLDYLSVSNTYGNFVTLRVSFDGQVMTVPTLLENGTNDFYSHDNDVEVMINSLSDDSGSTRIYLSVKSLGVRGNLDCQSAGF
jgi:hypothetical protein